MKAVEAHKYKTPLNYNDESPYSVGVMNLTEREAGAVMTFARLLQVERMAATKTEVERLAAMATTRVALTDLPADVREDIKREAARNRFSGLDI